MRIVWLSHVQITPLIIFSRHGKKRFIDIMFVICAFLRFIFASSSLEHVFSVISSLVESVSLHGYRFRSCFCSTPNIFPIFKCLIFKRNLVSNLFLMYFINQLIRSSDMWKELHFSQTWIYVRFLLVFFTFIVFFSASVILLNKKLSRFDLAVMTTIILLWHTCM